MGYPRTLQDKLWQKLSRWLRTIYINCSHCKTYYKETPEGFLHGHHVGNRHHIGNEDYVLCPFNILVLCQKCHAFFEPTSYNKLQLVWTDSNGIESNVECCGKGIYCTRYHKQCGIKESQLPNYQYKQHLKARKKRCPTLPKI